MNSTLKSSAELLEEIEQGHSKGSLAIALLPVGCVEQHGPFLPIETDSLIAARLAEDLCAEMERLGHVAYAFPPIHYTPTRSNMNYCGTASVGEETFRAYTRDVIISILQSPFDAVATVCSHGPAEPSLRELGFQFVAEQFRTDIVPIKPLIVLSVAGLSPLLEEQMGQKPGRHADWREFLMVLHVLGEEFFDSDRLEALRTFSRDNDFRMETSSVLGVPMEYRSIQGVVGEPLPRADCDWMELANQLWAIFLQHLRHTLHTAVQSFWEKHSINR